MADLEGKLRELAESLPVFMRNFAMQDLREAAALGRAEGLEILERELQIAENSVHPCSLAGLREAIRALKEKV